MDVLPILFDAQLVLIIGVLVYWALEGKRKHRGRRSRRWFRRRKAGIRCTDGKIVGAEKVPAMTAEEVIAVCNSLRYGS